MTFSTKEIFEHLVATSVLSGHVARSPHEPVEWETAYALNEILVSIGKIENHLLSALLAADDKSLALTLLEDIREELRHVAYHIQDASFFSVVLDKDYHA